MSKELIERLRWLVSQGSGEDDIFRLSLDRIEELERKVEDVKAVSDITPQMAFAAGRKEETEECAKAREWQTDGFAATSTWDEADLSCAKAIRARSTK